MPLDTAEGRLFYGERIALFHKTVGLLSLGFLVLVNALRVFDPTFIPAHLWSLENQLHLLAAVISIAVWLVLRRHTPSTVWLARIDVASTVAVMAAYILMALCTHTPTVGDRLELVLMLIAMIVQMARAVIVPSSARQTLFIGIGTSFALLAMTWDISRKTPHPPEIPYEIVNVAYIALWCAVTVTIATLASRVIYGLRQQVQEAQKLGQYTLEEKIGEGGMGIVYRAEHALLRRPTAVKLLPTERAGAGNLSRFEREVKLTSRLTHPNTVAIYDYGHTPDGIFYYAMEYLDGLNLEDLVELDGPQDPARIVHVLSQVCGALAEAHAIGLVHRDIKPANILLCERGGVPDVAKVVDFGLVKELEERKAEPGLSSANTIMGTPLYLSPEAIASPDRVDARSDLYALGAVAYYLACGQPVFDGKSLVEICGQHLHSAPVPPSERLGRALPGKLEAIILGCLAKDPAARPESAHALKRALDQAGVRAWTEEEGRSYWVAFARRRSGTRRRAATASEIASNLTIDLRRRAGTDAA
jgi:eukaryotic-like serine/threonine-protein kinase